MWCKQYEPKKSHTRLKFNFDRLLIIFFITEIHRVRFVSVNGEASRVKPSNKKFRKKVEKKFWKKNVGKKIWAKQFWQKNLGKIILAKKFWKKKLKKKFWKKIKKKMLKIFFFKYYEKEISEKKFWKKYFRKINSKTKIFITKLYSNIDKCHTFFALLASFDKTGWKTGSNETVCSIWFKIGSVARSHWTQGMRWFERSREKRYITACELSVTRYHMSGICFIVGTKF